MKTKNHVQCPFCRQVQYPCCKEYLLSSPSYTGSTSNSESHAEEEVHLTVHESCETCEQDNRPMFLKVIGFLVLCACIAIAIYAIVNVTEKN